MKKQTFVTFFVLVILVLVVIFVSSNDNGLSNNYLGFQEKEIEVENSKVAGEVMFSFVDNLKKLNEADIKLYQSSINKNVDSFFNNHRSFNRIAGKLMSQARALALFDEKSQTDMSFNIISPAFAKKRSSFWYYVPIIGSLVKSKHKSIETSRAGVYHYLKEKLDSADRDAKLKEYGFKNVEELRKVSDEEVENIARDPELRAGIDWTKVSTDLGETAVKTVVKANKAVLGGDFNPVKGTADNIKNDFLDDGEMQDMTLEDQMEDNKDEVGRVVIENEGSPKQTKRVTLGIRDSARDMLESRAGKVLEKKWSDWNSKKQEKVSKELINHSKKQPLVAVHKSESNEEHKFDINPGTWGFNSVAFGGVPLKMDRIDVEAGQVKRMMQSKSKTNTLQEMEQNNKKQDQDQKNKENSSVDELENKSKNQEQKRSEETENKNQQQNQNKPEVTPEKENQQTNGNQKDNFNSINPRGEQVQAQGDFNMESIQGPVNITLFPKGGPLSGSMTTPLGKANFNGEVNYSGKVYAKVDGTFEYPDPGSGVMVSCSLSGEVNGQINNNSLTGNFNASCGTDNYSGSWSVSW